MGGKPSSTNSSVSGRAELAGVSVGARAHSVSGLESFSPTTSHGTTSPPISGGHHRHSHSTHPDLAAGGGGGTTGGTTTGTNGEGNSPSKNNNTNAPSSSSNTANPAFIGSTGPQHTKEQRQAFEEWIVERFEKEVAGGNGNIHLNGLENYGNTCYCNSVLQALYNTPIRSILVDWLDKNKKRKIATHGENSTLLLALSTLFTKMSTTKKRTGVIGPREFILRMKEANEQFSGTQHQDAQEFLIWLLNEMNDELLKDANEVRREEEAVREKEREKDRKKAEKKGDATKRPPSAVIIPNNGAPTLFDSLPHLLAQLPMSPSDPYLPSSVTGGLLFSSSTPSHSRSISSPPELPQQSLLLQSLHALHQQQQQHDPAANRSSTPNPSTTGFLAPQPLPSPTTTTTRPPPTVASPNSPTSSMLPPLPPTFIQQLFEGELTNLTRCINCGSVSSRVEPFFDLSLEVEPDISLTYALSKFSSKETMEAEEKYSCPICACKQEACKSLHISKYPRILITHLKRFRYDEHEGRFKKVKDRLTFPMELRVKLNQDLNQPVVATRTNQGGPSNSQEEKEYELTAIVVHIGSGLRHGHYVSLSKFGRQWFCFDDDDIHLWSEADVKTVYGSIYTGDKNGHLDGYLLFYSQVGMD